MRFSLLRITLAMGSEKTGETHGTSVDSPPDSAVGVFSGHVLALKGAFIL